MSPWFLLLAACGALPAAHSQLNPDFAPCDGDFIGMQCGSPQPQFGPDGFCYCNAECLQNSNCCPHYAASCGTPEPTSRPTYAAPPPDCGPGGHFCGPDGLPCPPDSFGRPLPCSAPGFIVPTNPPTTTDPTIQPSTSTPTTSAPVGAGIFRSGSNLGISSPAGGTISLNAAAMYLNGVDLLAQLEVVQSSNTALRIQLAEQNRSITAATSRMDALQAENTELRANMASVIGRIERIEAGGPPHAILTRAPTSEPTNSRAPLSTGSPTTLPQTTGMPGLNGEVHSGQLTIYGNPALFVRHRNITVVANAPHLDRGVDGRLFVGNLVALTTMGGIFPALRRIEEQLFIVDNAALTTLGDAMPMLEEIASNFIMWGNPRLTTFGTAFRSLRRIGGYIQFTDSSSALTDFEALRGLTCHGGVYLNDSSRFCIHCPNWLVNMPGCPV